MGKKIEDKTNKVLLNKAVVLLGGVVILSEELGIHHTNISKWLHTDVEVPIKHAIKIEQLTKGKIKAKDLRPDIF
jgi:DNA-binding transcriptional regulator YdaS (Cro superfamily)